MDDKKHIADLEAALAELIAAVELKAGGRANPATYYSPRMEDAIERGKELCGYYARTVAVTPMPKSDND